MNRVFLDANILFSAAWREGAGLLRIWNLPNTTLITSHYAFQEAERNLEYIEQHQRLALLIEKVEIVPEGSNDDLPHDVMIPEKDRPILLAAIYAGATHLLTGDKKHFGLWYKQCVNGVQILRPTDYLAMFCSKQTDDR
ncbi:conserved hypothetical protein [Gammaproteobacteria bacterium]